MSQRNMSDIIEAYLKSFLKHQEHIEIKRSDVAEHFDCVPSQINYVINTRFTQEHGYMVESKRGGGGYIRILKIELVDKADQIDQMKELVGQKINQRSSTNLIQTLYNREIITKREAAMIIAITEKSALQNHTNQEQELRAMILNTFLDQLKYLYK
ncbi:CtsR family transcriptional regulator [Fundicoccus sp. Sow4_H7]|uniref:CtsR family transcriptional regulator n=1 Tax=Fundicoccus sp. Sow4_H7 TaxID=3438784 RepID=UPI003F8F0A1E